ncbi:MAG: AsmA family protein [Kiloniellales bacterium]|nr:AsmA family protein [Kiloniellales bacterium]
MTSQETKTEGKAAQEGLGTAERRAGPFGRALRWTSWILGVPLAAFLLSVAALIALGITIDLSALRGKIEGTASEALERKVTIDGPVALVPTLWPTVQVEGVHIDNPGDWQEADFLRLDLARAQLSVLSLLRGEVRIQEIAVEGLTVNLETDAEGEPNWPVREPAGDPQPEEETPSPALEFIELQDLSLTEIAVNYRDAATGQSYELKLNEVSGSAETGQPLQLYVQGAVQKVPYAVTLTGGDLASLFDGEAPWQLDVSAAAVGTNLTVTGEIAEPLRGRGLALDFTLAVPEMKELEVILGSELPEIGGFDLRGRLVESEGTFQVADLEGRLVRTAFSGALEADLSGPRPRLQGSIDIPRIDAGPLGAALAAGQEAGAEAEDVAETEEPVDIDDRILTLEPLANFDADFTLTVGEVVNSQIGLREASFRVAVQDGELTGPLSAVVAEVPFKGELRLAGEGDEPKVEVSLAAEQSDIGGLLSLLTRAEGIEGAFEVAELAVSARGESIRSLVSTTELRVVLAGAALSYGHDTGEQPVDFTLDRFDILFAAAGESRITAAGSLLKEPFSLALDGGTFVDNFVKRNWPLDLTATGAGAELRLSGTLGSLRDEPVADIDFSIAGDRLGDLSTWLGLAPEAEGAYALRGKVTRGAEGLRIRIDEGRIRDTVLEGDVGSRQEGDTPVTVIELAVGTLDLAGLADLAPEGPEDAGTEDQEEAFAIDVPILPQGIELIDSDIEVTIERVKAEPQDLTEIAFSSRIRDGYVAEAPLRAVFAEAAVDGSLSADLRGEVPAFGLDLRSTDVNVGDVLAQLGVAQGLELTAGGFELSLAVRGTTLRGILERSEFSAGLRDGLWRLRDPNTEGTLDLGIPEGRIEAGVGTPITLALDGRIDQTPVKIDIRTDSLASFAEPKSSLSATLNVKLLNAELEFTGTTPLPVAAQNLRFELDFSGERASDFDELLQVSLPPWGPYRLSGAFGSRESGYFIEDLQLGVGSSTLTGKLDLDTTAERPRLDLAFAAPKIQLDDFETGDWSPGEGGEVSEDTTETGAEDDGDVAELLSPQVMRSLDAALAVEVTEVLSGEDRLGNGRLEAALQDGRLTVEPIAVEVPGGKVEVGFALEPSESDISLEARAKIDGFDYGVLARRIDPESETGGVLNLDVDIKTRGPELAEAMGGAEGHIDFGVWPKDLEADLFDLWAVNLFTSVLPSLDSEASTVNCLIGRFVIEDGMMRPTALLVDTSRIQASGDGTIDFKKNTIDFRAAPRSKRPEMFSAQTPIRVRGRFEDFELGVSTGALAGTVFRMITSPVVVPFEWIFTKNAPADGVEACREAWGDAAQR